MTRKNSLTGAFGLTQAAFWMSFCLAVCFAAVHLQALGYSNTELGIVMAVGNVLGALLGPVLASAAERHPKLDAAKLNLPLFGLRALLLLLLFQAGHDGFSAAVYALYMAVTIAVNALNLKFTVDAPRKGLHLDYGIARGAGSLAFVLLSALMGLLVERLGCRALLWAGLAVLLLQAAANAWVAGKLGGTSAPAEEDSPQPPSSLGGFLREEPRFAFFLLGSILIYFAHNTDTNFMINVTQNVGGDTETMGCLNAFMAAAEIPVMLLYSRFSRGRRASGLLAFSVALFLVKAVAVAFAPNIPLLFAAHLLQAPSFALFTCAVVPYVSEVIAPKNAAKAQSLAFSVTTLGAVLASLIAGRLYDLCSVQTTLLAAAAACAAGVAICLPAIKRT